MSKTIDERIVKMVFESREFINSVNETIKSIDNLKSSLNLSESEKSFKSIEKAASNFDISNLLNAADNVSTGFKAMEIAAVTAIANISNRVTNLGVNLVKSLSVDQIAQGWNKYGSAIASQQTIMSAVAGKINPSTGEAYAIEDIVERIDKLKWYTDETSYNISQMTDAIGSFTSSGVDLDVATQAILGISNACADAGVSTEKASSAFIGLSKAIGQGYLSNGVWVQQIKTSGLTNSERFKQSILDSAVAMGTLNKVTKANGDIIYKTTNKTKKAGVEVSLSDFTTALSEQWATSDVLTAALNSYSDTVDSIYGLVSDGKIDTSSKVISDLTSEMEKQGKTLNDLGLDQTYDTASEAIQTLVDAYKSLGLEAPKSLSAFSRAQEAISLDQAIQATKDAVSSKWSTTFELIFGNYEEAKKLWTKLSNEAWDWFASGGEERNTFLKEWHESTSLIRDLDKEINSLEGQTSIASGQTRNQIEKEKKAIEDLYEAIKDGDNNKIFELYEANKHLYKGVLPDQYEYISNLKYIGQNNKNIEIPESYKQKVSEYLKDSVEARSGFEIFRDSLFKVLDNITTVINTIRSAWRNVFPQTITEKLIGLTESFEDFIDKITPSEEVLTNISNALEKVFTFLKGIFSVLELLFSIGKTIYNNFIVPIMERFKPILEDIFEIFSNIGIALQGTKEKAENSGFTLLIDILDTLLTILEPFFTIIGNIIKYVKDATSAWIDNGNAMEDAGNKASIFSTILSFIRDIVSKITGLIKKINIKEGITKALEFLSNLIGDIVEGLKKLINYVKELFGDITQSSDVSATALAGGLIIFKKLLDIKWWTERLELVKGLIKNFSETFGTLFQDLEWKMETDAWANYAEVFKSIGIGLLAIAFALKVIASVDPERLAASLTIVITLIITLVAAFKYLSNSFKVNFTAKKNPFDMLQTFLNKKFKFAAAASIADSLLKIAASVLVLAAALWVISKIDPDRLLTSVIVLGGILLVVKLLIDSLTKNLKADASNGKIWAYSAYITALGVTMMQIGLAIIEISLALALLSLLNPEKLTAGVIALSIILTLIIGLVKWILPKTDDMEMGGVKSKSKFAKNLLAIGAMMVLIGFAIMEISTALALLSLLNTEKLIVGAIALSIILTLIMGIIYSIVNIKSAPGDLAGKLLTISVTMILIGVALLEIAGVIAILSAISVGGLIKGGIAVFAILAIVTAIVDTLSAGNVASLIGAGAFIMLAIGMLILAPALLEFAAVLQVLSKIKWGTILGSIAKLAVVLLTLSLLLPLAAIGSVSLIILALGISLFGASLRLLLKPMKEFIELMVLYKLAGKDFAGTFTNMLMDMVAALTVAIPALILGLGEGIILILGKILRLIEVAIKEFVLPLAKILLETFVQVLFLVANNIGDIIKGILTIIINVIDALIEKLPEIIDRIIKLLIAVLNGVADAIRNNAYSFGEAIANILGALLDLVIKGLEGFFTKLGSLFFGGIKKIVDGETPKLDREKLITDTAKIDHILKNETRVGENLEEGWRAYYSEAEGETYYIPIELIPVVNKTNPTKEDIGGGFIDSMGNIEDNSELKEKLTLSDETANEIADSYSENGESSGEGYLNGVATSMQADANGEGGIPGIVTQIISGFTTMFTSEENMKKLFDAGYDNGNAYLLGNLAGFDINSPSKETMKIAGYAVEGLLIGFKDGESDLFNAGIDSGNASMKGLQEALSLSNEIIDEDSNPVITPVLDLSNIQNGANSINSLFKNNTMGLGFSPSLAGANGINLTLNTTFNVDSKQEVTRADVSQWGSWLVDEINEELGRRM